MSHRPSSRGTRLILGLSCMAMAMIWGGTTEAQQASSGFFSDPILILGGGGHQAPVRTMLFSTPDGSQLLTGGMDKVIHVWNLDVDRSGPARTLRPPNWRGSRGQVYAMALSPVAEAGNQRLLAVAGYGVIGAFGEILLFRYPGLTGQGTGEIVGQLPATAPNGAVGPGHDGIVTSLAFTPDGHFLVSGSNDKTVRIWDIANRRQVSVLQEAQLKVNTLAIYANGTRLVSGGSEGILRLYDITKPAQPVLIQQSQPIPLDARGVLDPLSAKILNLAVSPDNRWIIIGTEGGALVRYDATNLAVAARLPNPNNSTGPIEGHSISPDGRLLATSTIAQNLARLTDRPTVTCVIEIRSMPDGQVVQRLPDSSNLVYSFAFSPDSKRLAYAGGDTQAISIKELAPNSPPPDEIQGPGSSLWDVGFRSDSQAIRFARSRPQIPGQAAEYEYFDLRGRFFFNPAPNEPPYRHSVGTEAGWTIAPVDTYKLDFRSVQNPNQGWRRELDPDNERRWWSYTVIPPGPGHPQAVAAVAADAGIVLWNLVTGEKTRSFTGHAGSVYSLASSPDGKWLLTGSSDQTVRLWPLNGCDRPPPFGAKFERRGDGSWVVAEVTPGGFADGIALKKGLVIEKFFIGADGPAKLEDPSVHLPRLDLESPSWFTSFYARMNGDPAQPLLQVGSSKRDSPALTLFPGVDHRWVLWTPRGYYDSSADGDRKFLGWLTNRGSVAQLLAGSFDSIDKFEARYRQLKVPGNAIDRLLDTGDPLQAVAVVPPVNPLVVAAPPPPEPTRSRIEELTITPVVPAPTDRPILAAGPTVSVNYLARVATGAAPLKELWVEVNGRRLPPLIVGPPVPSVAGPIEIPVGNEREIRVNLVALDTLGIRRIQSLDITNQALLPPTPRTSRLEILAIGVDDFADKRFPAIRFAEKDAGDLSRFLGKNLVDPATGRRFAPEQVHEHPFLGGKVARANLLGAFDDLKKLASAGDLGAGDVVVVVVESHYLEVHSKRLLATSEPDLGLPEPASVSAIDLADRLAELTRLGCRTCVLIDAVHEIKVASWDKDIQEWVRQLQSQARTIAFIASDHGPSSPNGTSNRIFAEAVLNVGKASNAGRLSKSGGAISLFDFQRNVIDNVLDRTGRKQHAQCYLPDSIAPQVLFLGPSAPSR